MRGNYRILFCICVQLAAHQSDAEQPYVAWKRHVLCLCDDRRKPTRYLINFEMQVNIAVSNEPMTHTHCTELCNPSAHLEYQHKWNFVRIHFILQQNKQQTNEKKDAQMFTFT